MFVPKNIDKRKEDFKKIQTKQLVKFNEFKVKFDTNYEKMLLELPFKSHSRRDQLLVILLQRLEIKICQIDSFNIMLCNNSGIIFEYGWKEDTFYYNQKLLSALLEREKVNGIDIGTLVIDVTDKIFRFCGPPIACTSVDFM